MLIWRDAAQADITSVIFAGDPTMANQIAGFTKFANRVTVGGRSGNVWVSNQALSSAAADFILDVA